MGIHDRDYMRSKPPSGIFATGSWVTRLIVISAVVFLLQLLSDHEITRLLILSWPGLTEGRIWTVLTAAFLHADLMHLLFNGFGLYFFGRLAESALGPREFGRFALWTAVLAHVPFLAVAAARGSPTQTLGISGVVTACLVLAALRYPHTRFRLLFPPVPVKLWVLAVVYVGLDLFGVAGQVRGSGGGVNHLVHLAGAGLGFVAHRMNGLPIPRLPRGRSGRGAGKPPAVDGGGRDRLRQHGSDDRKRVDELLDKISREGIGSLTDEEREFLNRASREY